MQFFMLEGGICCFIIYTNLLKANSVCQNQVQIALKGLTTYAGRIGRRGMKSFDTNCPVIAQPGDTRNVGLTYQFMKKGFPFPGLKMLGVRHFEFTKSTTTCTVKYRAVNQIHLSHLFTSLGGPDSIWEFVGIENVWKETKYDHNF